MSRDHLPSIPEALQAEVDLVDHHDEVYAKWKTRGVYQRILLHFDAHIDFGWISDHAGNLNPNPSQSIIPNPEAFEFHMGNYLHRVLQEKMIRKWIWIVPTPIWQSRDGQRVIRRDLDFLYRTRTGEMTKPIRRKDGFETSFLGVETLIVPLHALPRIHEPVVLNIDVDFLTTRDFKAPQDARSFRRQIPWMWPEELTAFLQTQGLQVLTASISRSVQGGFTPIRYKFLGSVLCELLTRGQLPDAYRKLKHALLLCRAGKNHDAIDSLTAFKTDGDLENARAYLLATTYYEEGCIADAKVFFDQCVLRDSDYTTIFNSSARIFEDWGMFDAAYEEYQMMQALGHISAESLVGKARFEFDSGRREHAETLYHETLQAYPDNADCYVGLGVLAWSRREFAQSAAYFDQAIRLKPHDPVLHMHYARSAFEAGDYEKARRGYREALRLGWHLPQTYWGLALTYLRLGKPKKAFECFTEVARLKGMFLSQRIREFVFWKGRL